MQQKCIDDFGDTCFNSREKSNVQLNLLELEFETAYNSSELLGQEYITFW